MEPGVGILGALGMKREYTVDETPGYITGYHAHVHLDTHSHLEAIQHSRSRCEATRKPEKPVQTRGERTCITPHTLTVS